MTDTTILLVTYNRPEWYEQAHASALRQGCEVIVVDDGSDTDYAHADFRFANMGLAKARLLGLRHVTTPYVAFLDDDDVLDGAWLRRSRRTMDFGYDVVAASFIETDAELNRLRTHTLPPATLEHFLGGYCPVNDGALIRRSVLEGVTWHPERGTAVMFSLWLDLLAKGARFGVVKDAWLWKRRLHDSNMSATLGEDDARWRADAIREYLVPPWVEAFG